MEELSRYLPRGFQRPISDLAGWELAALERVAERPNRGGKRGPIEPGQHWAVAQTVTKMEHTVRRDIEETGRGAFLPTFARHGTIDGRLYVKEFPLLGGYVFFRTCGDDWAGIPDIHGVYDVLAATTLNEKRIAKRVTDDEMRRLVVDHASGEHNLTVHPRYTKYYRGPPPRAEKRRRRRPRPGKCFRNIAAA